RVRDAPSWRLYPSAAASRAPSIAAVSATVCAWWISANCTTPTSAMKNSGSTSAASTALAPDWSRRRRRIGLHARDRGDDVVEDPDDRRADGLDRDDRHDRDTGDDDRVLGHRRAVLISVQPCQFILH